MESRLVEFLDQFPERFVPAMIGVVERLIFLDRDDLGVSFARFVETTAPNSATAGLTTDPGKSANLLSYYLADHDGPLRQRTLVQALGDGGDLCLFDDFLMSGKQARTAVQQLLDLPADLREHVADPLDGASAAAFRETPLHFRFAAAHTTGIAALEDLIGELSLQADVLSMRVVDDETLINAVEGDLYADLVIFLRDVGKELLRSTKQTVDPSKWTNELCDERALGYSGFELLVASFYNVPTTTVTALWADGIYRKRAWVPLLPRRSRGVGQ